MPKTISELKSKWNKEKEFYNSMAKVVIKFCKKNKIDYHIKDGTATTDYTD